VTRTDDRSKRTGALALLLGFVAVLVLGAFHPLGLQRGEVDHVCANGAERHLDAPHEHEHPHDADACAFCHLARDPQQDVAPTATTIPTATVVDVAAPAPGLARPVALPRLADRSRAPPAA
jgi:hypothetical protein